MKVYVVIHSYCVNNWFEILLEQCSKLGQFGLYDKAYKVIVNLQGNIKYPVVNRYSKFVFRHNFNYPYEYPSLHFIHKNINRYDRVLYIHSKGVSRAVGEQRNMYDWRTYMEDYVIERWEECVNYLDEFDAVGVDWRNTPFKHFSGNFWWANANYIKKLPKVENYLKHREYCEKWIGLANPKVKCLCQTSKNFYTQNAFV